MTDNIEIEKYFPEISPESILKFNLFGTLLAEWNSKINVISRKDIDNFLFNHIIHSLSISKIINFKDGTSVVDVGTGGGLPGIPLAIMFPKVKFLLIDSIAKKIKVTQDIAEKLELKNVRTRQIRSPELKEKFDFVTGRAVTSFPKFVGSVRHLISKTDKNALPNGIIYLKGGDFSEELVGFGKFPQIYELQDYFKETFFETKKIIYLPV